MATFLKQLAKNSPKFRLSLITRPKNRLDSTLLDMTTFPLVQFHYIYFLFLVFEVSPHILGPYNGPFNLSVR